MKILAIRIRNLASLEGTTEIDFKQEPLCSAGIFAITGPTGAGKSTILDGLCLALYGKTPRFRLAEIGIEVKDVKGSTINQGDVRGILRDGTADGFAEVDFAGVDGSDYRATWSVRRARNKADGNLQANEVSLRNISNNVVVPGRKTELLEEIERLVGLSFDQFTRSVLLPQGDFTAFLKAGRDEKSSLLEKLTGTQVYSEISRRVFEKHRVNVQQLHELNIQRDGVSTLTSEEIDALELKKTELAVMILEVETQLAALGKEIAWYEQLANIEKNIAVALEKAEQATVLKNETVPRVLKLQLISRVQSIKAEVDGLKSTEDNLKDKTALFEKLKGDLAFLVKQVESIEAETLLATKSLDENLQKQEKAQPLLDAAKALDARLIETAKQLRLTEGEEKTAAEKYNLYIQQLKQRQDESKLLEKRILELNNWKDANIYRQSVAEHESLIISKLHDAQILLGNIKSLTKLINSLALEIVESDKIRTQGEKDINTMEASLQKLRDKYKRNEALLSGMSIAGLKADENNLDFVVQEIIAADAHWKVLHAATREHGLALKNLQTNKTELEESEEQITSIGALLETAKVQRETSLAILETARLSIAENVERLRDGLVPGKPCIVCGSTSHPYAGENPQLQRVLTELENANNEIEKNYVEYFRTHSGLQKSIQQLRKTIGLQASDLETRENQITIKKQQWIQFSIHGSCEDIISDDRTEWLQQQLKNEREKLKVVREQIKSYDDRKSQLEMDKIKLDGLEKKLTDLLNLAKDEERKLKSLKEQLAARTAELQKTESDLVLMEQTLANFFPSEDWVINWKNDPEEFALSVREFSVSWKGNVQQLEEENGRQELLLGTIKGLQEHLENLEGDYHQKSKNKAQLGIDQQGLLENRRAIFSGELVAKVESDLKKAIDEARNKFEGGRAAVTKIQGQLTRTQTQKDLLQEDISNLITKKTSLKEKIALWLTEQNKAHEKPITETDLTELLNFNQDWIEKERSAIRNIDDSLTEANSVLRERNHSLENHLLLRRSERSPEELKILEAEAKTHLQKNTGEHNEIGFRIRDDSANKEKIGNLLSIIAAQAFVVDNWAKLNEIIGSADGKKFRQIAQEYTLDVLLSYANVHLEVLSKRYVLERIPNSLGLQVIDQDMGDEVRTVYSLSGGESFLVSLALALGLASLSSSRMKVESLFIDEGFGSLDPATLNIAMDALERLHNQGRKVGVISHVQEMTERIPVQINVSKQQSGKSKVEVLGI
ncbi:AAA family ATPase [Flavitalea sp.]|nr:AAA family ATPase [Flavitalea sp.]